jgi:Tol biopolymer transport system component
MAGGTSRAWAGALVATLSVLAGGGRAVGAAASVAPFTVQASVDRHDRDPIGESTRPAISRDGRYVAFESDASDLVPGDHNFARDIYVRDLVAGTTTRVSVDVGGDANNWSRDPSISGDGRYVAFWSGATDLVPGDGNGIDDVFVRDLTAGTTVRASVDGRGGDPNGESYQPSLSGDGRYITFFSNATDLVPGAWDPVSDVFVRDLALGTTTRVSVDVNGNPPNGGSFEPVVSDDGRFVAFSSYARDLLPGNAWGGSDVYVRDVVAGTTTLVSVDAGGAGDNEAFAPSMSASGRYVAFWAIADDLAPGDGNGAFDVFVRDMVAGTTTLVSANPAGAAGAGDSWLPAISADGKRVAFSSDAADLVAGDANGKRDVFVRNVAAGTTTRVSVDEDGGDASGSSEWAAIDGSGHRVAFESVAHDIVTPDHNGLRDVFVRTLH